MHAPRAGRGASWVCAGQPPLRLQILETASEHLWDVVFSKMPLLFESPCVRALSSPSKQRLKALVLPSLTALSLQGRGRAAPSLDSRLLVEG